MRDEPPPAFLTIPETLKYEIAPAAIVVLVEAVTVIVLVLIVGFRRHHISVRTSDPGWSSRTNDKFCVPNVTEFIDTFDRRPTPTRRILFKLELTV